jgi:hypothetical protein
VKALGHTINKNNIERQVNEPCSAANPLSGKLPVCPDPIFSTIIAIELINDVEFQEFVGMVL